MSDVFGTAVSGMNAAIDRMANAANNIANASTTGKLPQAPSEKATAFEAQDVITLSNDVGDHQLGVRTQLVSRTPSYGVARDPSSPDANEQGLIATPNVSIEKEIVDTMMASIAYKANAKVVAAQKRNEETLIDVLA